MDRIGIIFGGRSGEHKVSCLSAASVIRAIDKEKYRVLTYGIDIEGNWYRYEGPVENIENDSWQGTATAINPSSIKDEIDFALPILHGTYGEDGTAQGFFEILGLPYGGCGVLASSVAMDKALAKEVFIRAGIPVCPYVTVIYEDWQDSQIEEIERVLGYPMFIKPANQGSSVGISKVKSREEFFPALKLASDYDRRIVIEKGLKARELELGVLGNHQVSSSVVGEIMPSKEFYDYQAKYLDGGKSKLMVPADIPENIATTLKSLGEKAYKVIDGSGFSRVDFFLDEETGEIYLNEINTIPGFTEFSMFPLLWGASGVAYSDLIERILDLGYERYYAKNRRKTV